MTSYAPNWTPRFKAGYRVNAIPHSITLRWERDADATTVAALATVAHDLFDALAAKLSDDFAWTESAYALTDSDVFVPCPPPADVTGLFDAADFSRAQKISPTTISGKSATGRARVSLYGIVWAFESPGNAAGDFVITAAEDADLAAAIAVLQAGAIGNAGELTMWHTQATYKVNDRLVKKARRGLV